MRTSAIDIVSKTFNANLVFQKTKMFSFFLSPSLIVDIDAPILSRINEAPMIFKTVSTVHKQPKVLSYLFTDQTFAKSI